MSEPRRTRIPACWRMLLQRFDVLQVERVARVVLRDEQHAARVGTDPLDGGLDRLHAQRQERGVQVVEPAGEEVRVDRRELEAGVAQIHRRVERHRMLLPLRAHPALDVGHPVEEALLEFEQRAGKRGGEMGNHGRAPMGESSDCSRTRRAAQDEKNGAPAGAPKSHYGENRLDPIRGLAVRADVEAFALFFLGHAQSDGEVDDLVGDEARPRPTRRSSSARRCPG